MFSVWYGVNVYMLFSLISGFTKITGRFNVRTALNYWNTG